MPTSNSSSCNPLFRFFFLQKVPAIIWILLLLTMGVVSYQKMVKEALPDLEIPVFFITTVWEGANASMVEKSVTQRLETELHGLKGLKRTTSSSFYSASVIEVTFTAESSIPECMQLLQQQVTQAQSKLPRDSERPKIEAVSVNDIPVTTIALSGSSDIGMLETLAEKLKRKLERIGGIRKVSKVGVREQVIHVQLLPHRLEAFGLSPLDVRDVLMTHGQDAPWGKFENNDVHFTLKMEGAYDSIASMEQLFVKKSQEGAAIKLRDVAIVRQSVMREKERAALSWQGKPFTPVVALSVLKAPGKDTIALVRNIERKLKKEEQGADWPGGVSWHLTGNAAETIESELANGLTSGWQAMLAVFGVLFVLLTWREALVAAFSVPLTLCGTLAILLALGYTFNVLMLIGMVIALGLLVDDFILIMEGMHEALFITGESYARAVATTLSTYAIPSFAGSATTILVFAPLAFISGVDGKFLRVIPVTAAACLVVSYLVSILLGPPLLRMCLRKGAAVTPGKIDVLSHYAEQKLAAWLGRVVVPGKKRAALWTGGALLLFVLSLFAADTMRVALYPKEDGRDIGITVTLAEGITMQEAERTAERVGTILRKKGYIEHVFRVVGGKGPYSDKDASEIVSRTAKPHVLGFGCYLVPGSERDLMAHEYAELLQREVAATLQNEPAAKVFVKSASGGPTDASPVHITIYGDDTDTLRSIAEDVRIHLDSIPGVYDVRDNIGSAQSEMRYIPIQEALHHHEVTQEELAGQMIAYMGNEKVAKFVRSGNRQDLDIRLGTWWESQQGKMAGPKAWEELATLAIITPGGDAVPLQGLAIPHRVSVSPVILHMNGQRTVSVMAKNRDIYVPEVLAQMRVVLEEMQQNWPQGYSYTFVGEKETDTTYSDMFVAFISAIVLVYAILALLFDSLLYPAIILSTVLFALVGVFFGFMLFGIPFSFSAAIGIVALVGIVVNDAIIVVETIRNHKKAGCSVFEAARRGAADRLRPITSTTVTNIAGLLPLALVNPGWAPICQAIIFGELTATVGAVILIPAVYVLLTPAVEGDSAGSLSCVPEVQRKRTACGCGA